MHSLNHASLRSFIRRVRNKPIPLAFIVGAQRSGTTWLQLLCAAHPRIAGGEESHLFSHYLGNLSNQYYLDRQPRENLPRPQGLPCFVTFDEWKDLLRDFSLRVLEKLLQAKPQAQLVIEKTPDHGRQLHLIRQLFPHAKVVHVIRDARDVVVSQMEASRARWGETWAASDAEAAAKRWVDWVSQIRRHRHPPELYLEIRYEELLDEGPRTLKRVYDFLGQPLTLGDVKTIYRQFTIDACRDDKAPQVLLRLGEMANQPVKPTAAGFFRAGQAGGWKTALSDEERETVESIAGELLRELGYETTPLPQIQQ